MTTKCERCSVSEIRVKLYDAIYDGRLCSLCERCSIIENIPIIKKPDANQLKESERGGLLSVLKRLTKAGKHKDTYFKEDELKELDSHPEFEKPETDKLNLIDNFHWFVMKERRRRGMSQKQFSQAIGESEIAIQMIEKGKTPENAERIMRKIEQFLMINLRKMSDAERLFKQREDKQKKPVLLDSYGNRLDIIPEDDIENESFENTDDEKLNSDAECKTEEFDNGKIKMTCEKIDGDLDLKKVSPKRVTIGQLKEIHRKKVEVTRQEKVEEQKKIEERLRILQALRERDRIKLEIKKKEAEKERDLLLEEKKKIDNEKDEYLKKMREEENKDIDNFLGGTELLSNNDEGSEDD